MSRFSVAERQVVRREVTLDYNELVQAVGGLGFPIVACCGLFWMINTTMKELTGAINKLSDSIAILTMSKGEVAQ